MANDRRDRGETVMFVLVGSEVALSCERIGSGQAGNHSVASSTPCRPGIIMISIDTERTARAVCCRTAGALTKARADVLPADKGERIIKGIAGHGTCAS